MAGALFDLCKGEEKIIAKKKSIPMLALCGAIGFGVGGAISGAALYNELSLLGFAISGAVGGALLGFILGGWRMALAMAICCAIGCLVGFMLALYILLSLWDPPYITGLFIGFVGGTLEAAMKLAIWGIFGGASLGAALGFLERRKEERQSPHRE